MHPRPGLAQKFVHGGQQAERGLHAPCPRPPAHSGSLPWQLLTTSPWDAEDPLPQQGSPHGGPSLPAGLNTKHACGHVAREQGNHYDKAMDPRLWAPRREDVSGDFISIEETYSPH